MGYLLLFFSCLSVVALPPVLCSTQNAYVNSRAAYYGSPSDLGTANGACGFGESGKNINGGDVAAVSRLYRDGVGCGACYQVMCSQPELCRTNGVKIVVTDNGASDNTDFILSAHAFSKLAQPKQASRLMAQGVVDIKYQRISCQYPGYNLTFKVHENSRFPDYLAIIFLYQAGQKDIIDVELWQDNMEQWKAMRRAFGGVWDMPNPPAGALHLRLLTNGSDGPKWVLPRKAIPGNWKAGFSYDSRSQLS